MSDSGDKELDNRRELEAERDFHDANLTDKPVIMNNQDETVESIKQKALRKFHDNHNDGDLAIHELVKDLARLHKQQILNLVSDDEVILDFVNPARTVGRNEIRKEIRQRINDLYNEVE